MKLNKNVFYDKVLGCWMGKNIGGTLGTPVEWYRQLNDMDFYTHDLNGEPLANDDLDLQLIWLVALEQHGVRIDARVLAEYWLNYQVANYSEYGIGKANLALGLMPPLSGTYGNEFKESCGAYIRSEIWACIAAGRPDLAAKYCYEDAIVDHGNGEGTYAAMFTGAMEAAAFVESDFRTLIKIGLSYIPEDCGTTKAIQTAVDCYDKGFDWVEARDAILELHRGCCMMHSLAHISQRDIDKGFDKGVLGYDVPSNIAILVAGMLYGEGDFDKTMCVTVNMGEDADCTAGTVGSIFGIIYGMSNIPQKWVDPIGHTIKTICVNHAGIPRVPDTVEELTDRTIKMAKIVSLEFDGIDVFEDGENDLSDVKIDKLMCNIEASEVVLPMNGPRFDHELFTISLDYSQNHLVPGEPAKLSLLVKSNMNNLPLNLNLKWLASDNFKISPQKEMAVPVWQFCIRNYEKVDFYVSVENPERIYEAVIEVSVPGRHTKLYIPVVFTSYNRKTEEELKG